MKLLRPLTLIGLVLNLGCVSQVQTGPVARSIAAALSRYDRHLVESGDRINAMLSLNGTMDQIRLSCQLGEAECRMACSYAFDISRRMRSWNSQQQQSLSSLYWDSDVFESCRNVGTSLDLMEVQTFVPLITR